jgi:BirA family transcriptional regulator, biotin operon repressor / biotin---[acetyl-CoA-carboxylase] ligase
VDQQLAPVLFFERVSSTMDVIHELADQGAPAGTMVIAGEQLAGRGSRGRTWHSPVGGLWLSALFRPPISGGIEIISVRTGLAVAMALETCGCGHIQLKWPNDLMLEEQKVGGILCEARWLGDVLAWVAVGVGLNVRNRIPAELGSAAIALHSRQPNIDEGELRTSIISALGRLDLRAATLSPGELDRFATRNWLTGRIIREPVSGTVSGLLADGTLLVRTADGSDSPVRSGSIALADTSCTS